MDESLNTTEGSAYTERLVDKETAWWKRVLDVQRPYRWNLQRLRPGFALDVGCGLGRNLKNLGGNGIGVDHNPTSVATARSRGLRAFTVDDFRASEFARPATFDSLLVAHVLEHLSEELGLGLLRDYLPFVKPGGKIILITPQEVGFRSDPTHVRFVELADLQALAAQAGVVPERAFSFPFPRVFGRAFVYNENVWVGRKAT